ncbi:hypothetical protein V8E53_007670 [Lactarius tabidus]
MAKKVTPQSSNPRTHCADRSTSAVAIFRAVSTPHYATFSNSAIYPVSPLSSHPSTDPPEDFQPSRTSTILRRSSCSSSASGRHWSTRHIPALKAVRVQYFFELRQAGHAELVGPDLWHGLSEEVDHDIYKCRVEDDVDAYEHTRVSSTPFAHCRALLYMLCSLAGEGSALRKGPRCRYTLAQVSHRQLYTVHETWSPNEASAYDPISDSTS